MYTIKDIINRSKLERIDAEVLLAWILNKNRTWLFAHAEKTVNANEWEMFQQWEEKRLANMPIAYITGTKEFYGFEFVVSPHVLIPRPCTEELVQQVLSFLKYPQVTKSLQEIDTDIVCITHIWQTTMPCTVVDIGTGSGAIACSIAKHTSGISIIANDVSKEAIEIASENSRRHTVYDRIQFQVQDGIEVIKNLREPFILVSNPPYIPTVVPALSTVHNYEPHIALYAGINGIDVVQPLLHAAYQNPYCNGYVIECQMDQLVHFNEWKDSVPTKHR